MLKLEKQTIQEILNFLGQRPFVEVASLIDKIQRELAPQLKDKEE